MQNDLSHVREIEAAWEGRHPARDPAVIESWLRCLNSHGLDPAKRSEAYIVPDRDLREHRQRSEVLIAIARSGIESLYALVAGQNYVLMLADRAGVTVEYLGDETQKAALRKSGLYLGAEWSEARAGTCALGACIVAGEAMVIHQSDHFDATHGSLSCTAAPIFDTRGGLTAVLDISLLSSPVAKTSQSLALNLVRASARRIEMANIMAESRKDWVLRLAASPEFLDVDPEAALSLDGAGRVIGMTHGAARILARAGGQDWRNAERIIGRPVSDFLQIRSDRLDDLMRGRPPAERFIETRDGHRLFAHAIEPRTSPPVAARRAEPPIRSDWSAFAGLAGEDAAMADLLDRASRLAPTGLAVLIEGETGAGKLTLARALHAAGRGPRRPFVVVDCAGLTGEGREAMLFGRGGRGGETGAVAEAEGGTLVLDKVDELPAPLQARLLRLAAEGCYVPPGAVKAVTADVRLLSTSQKDLAAEALAGRFRRDLYHRLSGSLLRLPPLRDRSDLFWLASRMLERTGRAFVLSPDALAALAAHDWPGNLRELSNMVAALAATKRGETIEARDLGPGVAGPAADRGPTPALIAWTLAQTQGNVSEAARRLKLDRSTIHRKIARYGLRPAR